MNISIDLTHAELQHAHPHSRTGCIEFRSRQQLSCGDQVSDSELLGQDDAALRAFVKLLQRQLLAG